MPGLKKNNTAQIEKELNDQKIMNCSNVSELSEIKIIILNNSLNCSTTTLLIRKMIQFDLNTYILEITKILKKLNKSKTKIKTNLILLLIDTIKDIDNLSLDKKLIDSYIQFIIEWTLNKIIEFDLWIDIKKFEIIYQKINYYISLNISEWTNTNYSKLLIFPYIKSVFINNQINVLKNKLVNIEDNKWLINYTYLLSNTSIHVVDGRNYFYDSKLENSNFININKILKFIITKQKNNKMVYIIFNSKHEELINEKKNAVLDTFKIDSLYAKKYIKFIYSPRNVDDDVLSIYLWLSNIDNILFSNDQYHNYAKKIHDNLYWYGLWNYFREFNLIGR
tara:strand:+ start:4508 stop:5515 length:1008 start_codon:yes stop_codon:yes gene_type:complete